ncbi:MAG: TonB-dependent receptor [Sphingomonadaceae bacterium]|uniref:TonB-dependent receptor n=1 Tax=Thermaurantiacus sp. TaxID=2820283 RepID=UPI00298F0DD9|nr:TonB-dependent receptor [Thermaurantiacus sp.]MCS6986369.1 TonB-dependent receptor [Sphingomonadaceae bacterium]MDW8414369.1 TonB-dependent receptor [Thermaurantiacus sp.]
MRHLLPLAAALPTPLIAQPAAQPMAEVAAEEIVVSAQKVEQRLLDVPITVTAVTGDRMARIGITQFDQLSAYVPGLNIQEQSPNNPGFVIRGITSDSGSAQEAMRVSVYYLGVDVSRSRGSYFDLFDIQRVEVVKGPQATLFGTAAAIGAVSVIPNGVEDGRSAAALLSAGNYGQRQVQGFVNWGQGRWGARLAGAYKTRNGVVRNIAGEPGSQNPGGIDQRDLNGQDQAGLRASLMAEPLADLRLDLVYTYDGQRAPGTAFKSGTFRPTGGDTSPYSFAELAGSPQSREVLGAEKLSLTRDVHDLNLTARWAPEGGRWSYTAITAWRKFDSLEVFDADGSQAWFLEFAEDARGRQVSHESRVAYVSERVRAFAGFNVFAERGTQSVPFSTEEGIYLQCLARLVPGIPCVGPDGRVEAARVTAILTRGAFRELPYRALFRNGGRIRNWSLFADASVEVSPRLELSAGLRYLRERRTSTYFADQPPSVLSRAPLLPFASTDGQTFEATDTNDAWLPRFNLLFRAAPDLNLYATVAKGRRSPVLQLSSRRPGPGRPAEPLRRDVPAEVVWNVEGGVKGRVGPVTATLGVFWQTYDNFQVTLIEGGQAVTRNAGSATNLGVEAELSWALRPGLVAFGNMAFIDAGIDDRPENGIFAGDRFRLQPRWQASGGFDLRVPLSDRLTLFAVPTFTYRSRLFFELPNRPEIAQGPVALLNARAGLEIAGRWQVAAFARNALDREYLLDAGNTGGAFGFPTFIRALPGLYGIEVGLRL